MRIHIRRRDNKAQKAQPAASQADIVAVVPFERQVIWTANQFSASYAAPSNHCWIALGGS